MITVFFICGLACFTLGFSVLIYPKKESAFRLAGHLRLIGLFGVLHGLSEWAEMFMLMGVQGGLLKAARTVLLPLSFFFLLRFGADVVAGDKKKPALRAAPALLLLLWTALFLGTRSIKTADISARYLLGAPGTLLTSYALFRQMPVFKGLGPARSGLGLSAGVFFLYGLMSGLIVPEAGFFPASVVNYRSFMEIAGMPVQALRAACAVVIAYGMMNVLRVFDWESRERIKTLLEESPKPGKKLKISAPPPALRGRVLLMEDMEILRLAGDRMLRELGFEVTPAEDGREAIGLYTGAARKGNPFDAVILAPVIKGGMGGLEAIRALREIYPEIKALVSSDYPDDPVAENFGDYGFDGVLVKPYGIKDLDVALARLGL